MAHLASRETTAPSAPIKMPASPFTAPTSPQTSARWLSKSPDEGTSFPPSWEGLSRMRDRASSLPGNAPLLGRPSLEFALSSFRKSFKNAVGPVSE